MRMPHTLQQPYSKSDMQRPTTIAKNLIHCFQCVNPTPYNNHYIAKATQRPIVIAKNPVRPPHIPQYESRIQTLKPPCDVFISHRGTDTNHYIANAMQGPIDRAKNPIRTPHIPQCESRIQTLEPPCDVFISHRGMDTKRNVAGLLCYYLALLNLHPFLDSKSMKPGDKLFARIDDAIQKCEVGVVIFSPHYCESHFCLHELALLTEMNKKIISVFFDVKPSQLQVVDDGNCSASDLQRFRFALDKVRNTVGIAFNTFDGDWSKLIRDTSDAVINNLAELNDQE